MTSSLTDFTNTSEIPVQMFVFAVNVVATGLITSVLLPIGTLIKSTKY